MTSNLPVGATPVRLQKLHGTHNTFVVLDERSGRQAAYSWRGDYPEAARRLCARDGPMEGADGVLVLRDDAVATAALRIFNADGSEAEMCGNGVRCVARHLWDAGMHEPFSVATPAGMINVSVTHSEPFEASVDMGDVAFPRGVPPVAIDALAATWRFYHVDVGNPHAVAFVDDVEAVDLMALGSALQQHPSFTRGINVHLVQRLDATMLRARHYERGAGLTQACGTGAVACAAVAIAARGYGSPLTVRVPGGALHVVWRPGASAFLRGPAVMLFEREVML